MDLTRLLGLVQAGIQGPAGAEGARPDPLLVALSVAMALLAAHTALDLARDVPGSSGATRRLRGAAASLALGAGLWSASWVSLLAFSIPHRQPAYQGLPVALALLLTFTFSALSLFAVTRGRAAPALLAAGSAALTAAAAGAHFLIASAMLVPGRRLWDPLLLVAAIPLGLLGSACAYRLAFGRPRSEGPAPLNRLAAATLLGAGIAVLQQVSTHALSLEGASAIARPGPAALAGTRWTASLLVGATGLLLLALLTASIVERALSRRQRVAESKEKQFADAELARSELERRANQLEETTWVLHALIHSAPLAVVELAPNGEVRTWNPAAERLFGWKAAETVGQRPPIVPPELQEEHQRICEAALAGESVSGYETRRTKRDGSTVEVALSVSPLRGEGGMARGLIAMYSDIADRKRAEEERVRLLEGERSARVDAERSTGKREALAELGQRALAGADAEVLMHEAVRLLVERLQVEHAEVLQLLPDGDRLQLRAGVGWRKGLVGSATVDVGRASQAGYTLLSRGPVVVEDLKSEERFVGPSLLTEHGVVSGVSVIIEGRSGPWGVLGTHSKHHRDFSQDDIAFVQAVANILAQAIDRSRADEERMLLLDREREARGEAERRAREESALRQAAEAVGAPFTIGEVIQQVAESALSATDADGSFVTRIDPEGSAVEVVARAGEATPRVGFRSRFSDSVAQRVIETQQPLLMDRSARHEELDGLVRACGDCSLMVVPLGDADDPVGALILVREAGRPPFREEESGRAHTFGELATLAFRKVRLLDESERRRDELERVTESRARLIRGFSHDVKNPLGAADGYLELLEQGIVDVASPKGADTITRVRRSIRSALGLIDDLVALGQAETGVFRLQDTPVDAGEIVREIADEHRARAEAKGLALEVKLPRRLPTMRSDPARVRQILGNLVSNAVKYTDQGGVELGAEETREESGRAGAAGVALHVRDSGPGIPPEKVRLLFREFSRLGSEKEGIGIGLAISHRLAEALGGEIRVDTQPGKGSTFTLWLPRERRAGHRAERAEDAA
jgi:PAS domain S-box-containing protein